MRSATQGLTPGISHQFNQETTLSMFRTYCATRFFEIQAKDAYDDGHITSGPIYLSVGNEAASSAISESFPGAKIFGQHRCHNFYLGYGGDPTALADELLGMTSGCAKGMGGSASIHSPEIGMFGHSGLMGDQAPIAVGYALGSGDPTLAILGDASAEEDYVLGALGYASTKNAPVLFAVIDNGLSILTEVGVRRNWTMKDAAQSFKMHAVDITDDPWLIMHHVNLIKDDLPALINIHTSRVYWHAGTGTDGPPEWDRFELVKDEMQRLGLGDKADSIEKDSQQWAKRLWQERINSG